MICILVGVAMPVRSLVIVRGSMAVTTMSVAAVGLNLNGMGVDDADRRACSRSRRIGYQCFPWCCNLHELRIGRSWCSSNRHSRAIQSCSGRRGAEVMKYTIKTGF